MAHTLAVSQWRDGTLNDVLALHGYPHAVPTSAWRLITRTIAYECQTIAAAWASLPAHVNDVPGPHTVVLHARCNDYILNLHNDYGILPNRFLLDRLPADTEEVVIVRQEESLENGCLWSMMDLADELQQRIPSLKVRFRSSQAWESDWLYPSRARTLFCSPSTFCLTAAWANPNRVFFATNGPHAAVVSDAPTFRQRGIIVDSVVPDATKGFTWVQIDYIPGKTVKVMSKDAVLNYTRSAECLPLVHGCIPSA